MLKTANRKDLAAAAMFISVGAFFALNAYLNLRLGTARQMGPGYFPLLVGGILAAIGLVIGLRGFWTAPSSFGTVNWRGVALICVTPILFGLVVQRFGLVPAIALATLVSAFASRRMGLVGAAGLTIGLTVFCVLVFSVYLGVQMPLLRWPS